MIAFNTRCIAALGMALAVSISGASVAQSQSLDANGSQMVRTEVAGKSYQRTVQKLRSEGFKIVSVKKSLLGRIRVLALKNNNLREIIISRSTGEIKRDAIISNSGSTQVEESQTSSGSSSSGTSLNSEVSVGVGNGIEASAGASGGLTGTSDGVVGNVGGAIGSAIDGLGL
ncbi:hypothetical protein [Litoreibacter halocynthiae]|uniref:hypothetical protein n=1 Tax=Litoreibacter halocynthiae TaxID=1242689 RepID=UPI0024921C64|nr:hypothetical protein [Litoreibacter halocynthiae]